MKVIAHIVNAFSDGPDGGNPAGVVLDADTLSKEQKQTAAAKLGLSETVFLSRSKKAEHRTEFFTPSQQIADCGHATVAAFSLLHKNKKVSPSSSKETVNGVRKIRIDNGRVYMEQNKGSVQGFERIDELAASLGISKENLSRSLRPSIVTTEVSFLIVPIQSKIDLENLEPNFDRIHQISKELDLVGYYLFTDETYQSGRDVSTRMFAPAYGINEESATGMGAGTLASFLYEKGKTKKEYWIEQGYAMSNPGPSLLHAQMSQYPDTPGVLWVGGSAQLMETRTVEV